MSLRCSGIIASRTWAIRRRASSGSNNYLQLVRWAIRRRARYWSQRILRCTLRPFPHLQNTINNALVKLFEGCSSILIKALSFVSEDTPSFSRSWVALLIPLRILKRSLNRPCCFLFFLIDLMGFCSACEGFARPF
jgi:hypothetical protein